MLIMFSFYVHLQCRKVVVKHSIKQNKCVSSEGTGKDVGSPEAGQGVSDSERDSPEAGQGVSDSKRDYQEAVQGVSDSERISLEAGEHGIDSNETGEMHVNLSLRAAYPCLALM